VHDVGRCGLQIDIRGALPPPSAFHRCEDVGTSLDKFSLVVCRQLHHRGVLVGISKRCENLSTDAKIGMTHVRRFNCLRKTQRQFAKFIWRHCFENLLCARSCSVQCHLPQKKKKRKPKRDTDDQCSKRRQPKTADLQTFTFGLNKQDQHDRRKDHIHRKERADPVGEQFAKEQREIQAVLEYPWHKL